MADFTDKMFRIINADPARFGVHTDGLASFLNKHPMRGWEGDPSVFGLGHFEKVERFGRVGPSGTVNTMNNGEEYYSPARGVAAVKAAKAA